MEIKKELVDVDISKLKLYKSNSKLHSKKQIEHIKKSIQESGYIAPIEIDENNTIISGEGRFKALKELKYKKIQCLKVTGFKNEDVKKLYIINTNKTNMETGFNYDILYDELDDINLTDLTLDDFGIDIDNILKTTYKENERHRTNDTYNLSLGESDKKTEDFWQMPIIKNENIIPSELIGFNYAKTSKNKNVGIHFYIDDYQFERIWNNPEKYINILKQYKCILSPDFSLYIDMPMPMKIWNIYRNRKIGAYYQSQGIKVIPTLSWGEEETYKFCFKGLEPNGIYSVSTIGVKKNNEALKLWKNGMDEAIRQLKPKMILLYGGEIDYDFKNIKVKTYENKIIERIKEVKNNEN